MKKFLFREEKDKVDIEFIVEEEFSGSIAGSLGYGAYGFNLGANYSKVMLLELVIVLVLGLITVIGKQMFLLISLILISILMELV